MAAPLNNNNAGKWTVETARELAEKAYNIVGDDCYLISEVAEKCDTYRDLFLYLLDKYNDDEIVFRTLKRMQNKCEMTIAKKTADGDIIPSLGIFILKSYHGLTETSKQIIEHDININNDGIRDKLAERIDKVVEARTDTGADK